MILSCTKIADQWLTELKQTITSESLTPRLGIVLVGDSAASKVFIQKKREAAEQLGVTVQVAELPEQTTTDQVVAQVRALAAKVDGLIVQLPLPSNIDAATVLDAVPPAKDVDGLGCLQIAASFRNEPSVVPATVRGILYLLEHQKVSLAGRRVLIVGAGQLVGRPLALTLLNRGASVLIAEKAEPNLKQLARNADVLVSATGVPGTITAEHVHKDQLVLDAGFSRVKGKTVGDVATAEVSKAGAVVTPVPGGIGALTVAGLFANLIDVVFSPKS